MKKRNIVVMLLLTIITFGIYTLYWSCSFQNQLKAKTGQGFGGFGHLVMLFVTFGIYSIYWHFVVSGRLARLGARENNLVIGVLALIGLSIVSMFMLQNDANNLPEQTPAAA